MYPYDIHTDLALSNIAKDPSWKLFIKFDSSRGDSYEDFWYNTETGEITTVWRANGLDCLGACVSKWTSNGKPFYYYHGAPSRETFNEYINKWNQKSSLEDDFTAVNELFDMQYKKRMFLPNSIPIQEYKPRLDEYVSALTSNINEGKLIYLCEYFSMHNLYYHKTLDLTFCIGTEIYDYADGLNIFATNPKKDILEKKEGRCSLPVYIDFLKKLAEITPKKKESYLTYLKEYNNSQYKNKIPIEQYILEYDSLKRKHQILGKIVSSRYGSYRYRSNK